MQDREEWPDIEFASGRGTLAERIKNRPLHLDNRMMNEAAGGESCDGRRAPGQGSFIGHVSIRPHHTALSLSALQAGPSAGPRIDFPLR